MTLEKNKKIVSVAVIAIVVVASIAFLSIRGRTDEPAQATIDDLLNSRSVRAAPAPDGALVSMGEPFLTLAATPVTMYYDGTTLNAAPLLMEGDNPATPEEGVSKAVGNFFEAYGKKPNLNLKRPNPNIPLTNDELELQSLELALNYWESSDGALLIEPTQAGYDAAVNAVPIASYLNIPVIITDDMGSSVSSVLDDLDVRYTLVCGDLRGYGKVWNMECPWEVRGIIATGTLDDEGVSRSLLGDRLNANTSYIALANPMDIEVPDVLDSFTETFSGTVTSSDTGSTSFPTTSSDTPTEYFEIPENYTYARVTIDSYTDCVNPTTWPGTPQDHGERSYVYFGIDNDGDGAMSHDEDSPDDRPHFMVPSIGYEYIEEGGKVVAHGHADNPIFNSPGKKVVQIKATLDQKPANQLAHYTPGVLADIRASTTSFTIDVLVEKLDSYNYPRVPYASSMAPYLAAFRQGVVLASPTYSIHNEQFVQNPNCGDPAVNGELFELVNDRAAAVKDDLNRLLGELAGIPDASAENVAQAYKEMSPNLFCVGIIADTNMVPWYYYPNTGQVDWGESEGFGTPSDNGYADIDLDLTNPPFDLDGSDPTMELGVGRICGWDVQDTSALLARTFFYSDIVGSFQGHSGSWEDSAMTSFGDKVPVESAKSVTEKLDQAFDMAGFACNSQYDLARSDSKLSSPTYETSNLIFECAHGYYYWFVPPGYKATGPGGGFHVANVKDMNFGPSVLFASSCVTGKIDGIPHTNALSQAFLHSGMNAYVGASRLSWGSLVPLPDATSGEVLGGYMGLLFYSYITGFRYDKQDGLFSEVTGDLTLGQALSLAKNDYISANPPDNGGPQSDTAEEFNLHGDPAFNPFEPIHEG